MTLNDTIVYAIIISVKEAKDFIPGLFYCHSYALGMIGSKPRRLGGRLIHCQWWGCQLKGCLMSKDFARKFYSSQAWNNCREAYMNKVHHLCERCLAKGIYKPAQIVHHKIEITPDNIGNPKITLSHDNLEAVCRECHAALHEVLDGGRKRRYFVAPNGSVIIKENEKNF